jgi:hypothetical protein
MPANSTKPGGGGTYFASLNAARASAYHGASTVAVPAQLPASGGGSGQPGSPLAPLAVLAAAAIAASRLLIRVKKR